MDKLKLLNEVAKVARPASSEDIHIDSLDTLIKNTSLDSLDMLMVMIFLGDIYGIHEDAFKTFLPITAGDIFVFMDANKTKEPTSLEAALESIK